MVERRLRHELFAALERKLRAAAKSTQTASEWSDLRDAVFESCVSVLEELRAEGAFGTGPSIPVVVFAVSDWQDARKEKRWMKRLNSPATYKAFASWLG